MTPVITVTILNVIPLIKKGSKILSKPNRNIIIDIHVIPPFIAFRSVNVRIHKQIIPNPTSANPIIVMMLLKMFITPVLIARWRRLTSLVILAIRDPVGFFMKNEGERVWRWKYIRFLMSVIIR